MPFHRLKSWHPGNIGVGPVVFGKLGLHFVLTSNALLSDNPRKIDSRKVGNQETSLNRCLRQTNLRTK
jgi:hypothetical protein